METGHYHSDSIDETLPREDMCVVELRARRVFRPSIPVFGICAVGLCSFAVVLQRVLIHSDFVSNINV